MESLNDNIYKCLACNTYQYNAYNLNKHIFKCIYYNEFIKTYKPKKTICCEYCKNNFSYIDIKDHISNCKKNNF